MFWIVWWGIVSLVGVAGTVASINGVRFGRRVHQEMRQVSSAAGLGDPVARPGATDLPPPVERFRRKAIARPDDVRTVRLRHGGRFRASLNGAWLAIRGEQYFTADPPAFVWWGRVRLVPGIWIDARDRSVAGLGNMLVSLESSITLANRSGSQVDQGALLRLLGEMAWFPTAWLDARYVRWSPVDDHRATATLRVGEREVAATFQFDTDELPTTFTAERFRDVGGGKAVLTPFVGRSSTYRFVDGLLVPHRVTAAWVVEDRAVEYVDFELEQIEFNRNLP